MKKQSLLKQMYKIHQKHSSTVTGRVPASRKRTRVQEAQYSVQLPVSLPKSKKEFWDELAERKREEAGSSDPEVVSS